MAYEVTTVRGQRNGIQPPPEMFWHYYWTFNPAKYEEIHSIFNGVCTRFPRELTYMVVEALVAANEKDKHYVCSRPVEHLHSVHHELFVLRKRIVGFAAYDANYMPRRRVYGAVDPATWLSVYAYTELVYQFDLDNEITGRAMELPMLRDLLTDVGLRAVRETGVRGAEVIHVFAEEVKKYYRVITATLYRRHLRALIEEIRAYEEEYEDVYIN